MEKQFSHTPVMLKECLTGLNIQPNGIYVDCTLGGAGHSLEILKQIPQGKLIAIDKDDDALQFSKQKLKDFTQVEFVKADFKDIKTVLSEKKFSSVHGILADLGVSSYQIDTPTRGFSYIQDGKLDMRMDQKDSFSAFNVVNDYSQKDLENILFTYGEEQFTRKIAKAIVSARVQAPIETTQQLVDLIEKVVPKNFHGGHVAKKTFQAIRIEVNGELEHLKNAVQDMIDCLKPKGRLAIITFHSLEDRIVKNVFKLNSTDCICDKSSPICTCHHKASIKLVNKKPLTATPEELISNKRSSSAKLRILEKL